VRLFYTRCPVEYDVLGVSEAEGGGE